MAIEIVDLPMKNGDVPVRYVYQRATKILLRTFYHLVRTNSSPWKIHPFLRTVNHLFQWAMASMATLNNQRVVFKKGFIHMNILISSILSMILNIPYDFP